MKDKIWRILSPLEKINIDTITFNDFFQQAKETVAADIRNCGLLDEIFDAFVEANLNLDDLGRYHEIADTHFAHCQHRYK